tara:strand:+ start:785 stop:2146 length:1362 start_codon:yes stop_codon:yes gene_type:complete
MLKRYKYNLPDLSNCSICIIGLGYVGLPLAIEFSKVKKCLRTNKILNRKVIGFDLNKKRIKELKEGKDFTKEINYTDKQELKKIKFISDPNANINADVFIISVPTPTDKINNPDLNLLKSATASVANFIKKRDKDNSPLVILESTVYPGTTENICIPIIEKITKYKLNKDFFFGYSPERINPGDKTHCLTSIVKVTSGSNIEIANWIDDFYGSIIKAGTYKAKSIKVAEAAKVIENTQRDINIALVNEIAKICKSINIDTLDVLDAAESKWNFQPFRPGLVGGHCISVDPYYLTYIAKENGYDTNIVLAGRNLNDGMSEWITEQLFLEADKKKIHLSNAKILVLGLTFKENCPDIRNSKVLDVIEILNKKEIIPHIYDPYINNTEKFNHLKFKFLNKSPFSHKIKYEIIILTVAHNEFKNINESKWKNLLTHNNYIIYDLKGIIPREIKPIRI